MSGCLSLLLQSAHVVFAGPSTGWRAASVAALLILCAMLVLSYRRRRLELATVLLEAPLLVLASAGVVDPLATVGLVLVVLAVQSLYGTQRGWLTRIGVGLASLPVAVALTPVSTGQLLHWQTSAVLGILPQLVLVCVVMRAVYGAMINQQRASARDAVLARIGNQMLGATDTDQVHALGAQAADELVALSPGVVTLFVRGHDDRLQIFGVAGLPTALIGTVLPGDVLTRPRHYLDRLAPHIRHWDVEDLTAGRYRLLGGVRELDADVVDAFRTMAHQVLLAESSRQSADELRHQAYHDALTQLPNRALFFGRLADAVDRLPPGSAALLNIDLDDFKIVNDTHGHAAGDEVLVAVAAILREAAGPDGVAARFGGDEFAVLLTGLGDAVAAEAVAAEICRRVMAPFQLSAATARIGASIGVAVTRPGLTAGDLTRCADIAMYSAKAQGKNRVEVFDPARHGDIARHRTLEQHLHHAAARDEIELRLQPYVSVATGECAGVEAVARWLHPTIGAVSHADLLDLADRTGQLAAVGVHLLREACSQFAAAAVPGLRLSIAVTGRFLAADAAVEDVLTAAAAAGLPADRLMLVVPENDQLNDPTVLRHLHRLVAAGATVSVDGFGTGALPLAALESFPLHQVAAGPALLQGGGKKLAMVNSVARLLEAQTLVRAVDTPDRFDLARRGGADVVQGAAIAPPMTAGQLRAWLATDRTAMPATDSP
ncbi:bifunctional diguanylate cyclase/phosphodiesterase [Actinoplanes sp. N902-109]|uniref:putative bifunctional diguanylate cyclase/phosphodiesterase n=1 Tax=Actinoplanes sp. (strain N902-109) TaxID=649831 RepID=UPI0012F84A35|nr:diguanylate cyclase [Actinoplanes sp. N902-109]